MGDDDGKWFDASCLGLCNGLLRVSSSVTFFEIPWRSHAHVPNQHQLALPWSLLTFHFHRLLGGHACICRFGERFWSIFMGVIIYNFYSLSRFLPPLKTVKPGSEQKSQNLQYGEKHNAPFVNWTRQVLMQVRQYAYGAPERNPFLKSRTSRRIWTSSLRKLSKVMLDITTLRVRKC